MMDLNELHPDEIRHRLGLPPVDGDLTVEGYLEAAAVAAMPEPFDPETDAELELLDITEEKR